jgi:WD40 repeat protein
MPTWFIADEKHDRFAYCASDHIVIRKISSPHECEVYRGQQEPTCIRFSFNGLMAASGDAHGFLKIWNTADSGITRLEQQILAGPIRDVAWSPDDQRILVVGEGRGDYAVVIMADGGSRVGKLTGFTAGCVSCDFRPARPFKMGVICNDRKTAFWKGPPLKEEWCHEEAGILARQLRYSPDGSHFISVGSGKSIIYDGTSGEKVNELPVVHKGTITGVSWSPDSKQVITSCCDQTVKLWDIATCECTATFEYGDGSDLQFQQLGCAFMGDTVASVSLNGDINFVRPAEGTTPSSILSGLMGKTEGFALIGDTLFAGGTADGTCKVVSYKKDVGAVSRVSGEGPDRSIVGMAAIGSDVVTLSMDGVLNIASSEEHAFVSKIADLEIPTKGLGAGEDLLVCASEHSITVHRKSGGYAVLSKLEDLDYSPLQVAIAPAQDVVAVSSSEERGKPKKIVLYNVEGDTLTPFKEITNHRGAVYALEFSPDGAYLAAGDGNREVRVYDRSKDYECLREDLQYNNARVTCISWHPDSDMLVSGDIGRSLVVTHIGKLLRPTVVDRLTYAPISTVQFMDADTIAVGDTAGEIFIADFKKL